MASGRLIDYLGEGLFSARPVTPNLAAGALGLYYATDTSVLYAWDGSAWDTVSGSSGAPITATTAATGTTLTATGANAWNYTRFTNAGTKTYTFDSAQTYATNAEYHGRNVGAGNLTIAQAGTFVITPPAGGSLVIPQGQSFFLKITGTNTADLILQSPSGTGPPDTPFLVGSSPLVSSALATISPTIPAAAAVGDLLIAYVMRRNVVTPPAGWTFVGETSTYTISGTNQNVGIYYKIAVSGDLGTSPTWTAAAATTWSVTVAAFRKPSGAALVFDSFQTNTAVPASPLRAQIDTATLTIATADNLVIISAATILNNSGASMYPAVRNGSITAFGDPADATSVLYKLCPAYAVPRVGSYVATASFAIDRTTANALGVTTAIFK